MSYLFTLVKNNENKNYHCIKRRVFICWGISSFKKTKLTRTVLLTIYWKFHQWIIFCLSIPFLCKYSDQYEISPVCANSFYCRTSSVLHIRLDTRYPTNRFQSCCIYSGKTNTYQNKNSNTSFPLNMRNNHRRRIGLLLPQVWR